MPQIHEAGRWDTRMNTLTSKMHTAGHNPMATKSRQASSFLLVEENCNVTNDSPPRSWRARRLLVVRKSLLVVRHPYHISVKFTGDTNPQFFSGVKFSKSDYPFRNTIF